MLTAIQFDGQASLMTVEIDDEISYSLLPLKSHRISSQEIIPQMFFISGRTFSKFLGKRNNLFIIVYRHDVLPFNRMFGTTELNLTDLYSWRGLPQSLLRRASSLPEGALGALTLTASLSEGGGASEARDGRSSYWGKVARTPSVTALPCQLPPGGSLGGALTSAASLSEGGGTSEARDGRSPYTFYGHENNIHTQYPTPYKLPASVP